MAKMMIKTIKDEFGFVLPDCYAGVTMAYDLTGTGVEVKDGDLNADYDRISGTEVVRYKVSYFASNIHFAEGYPPRPLKTKVGDVFTDTLEVDLSNPRVISILSQNIPHEDKMFSCIDADLDYRLER